MQSCGRHLWMVPKHQEEERSFPYFLSSFEPLEPKLPLPGLDKLMVAGGVGQINQTLNRDAVFNLPDMIAPFASTSQGGIHI